MTNHDHNCRLEERSAIDRYMRDHFRKEPPGTTARWLGESAEYGYVVRSVTRHDVSGAVRGCSVLRVTVEDAFLRQKERGGGSTGIFSVCNGAVCYLTPEHPESLARIMQGVESATDATAKAFADLWCEAILSGPKGQYVTLVSAHDVEALYPEARGYELNREVWRRAELRFISPTWQRDEAGVSLEFFALVADFKKYEAHRILVRVACDGPLTLSDDVVVESIFSHTPFLRA